MARRRAGSENFWKLRIGRGHYWIGVVVLTLATVALMAAFGQYGSYVLGIPMLILFSWRLHDMGLSGWWGFGANFAANMLAKIGTFLSQNPDSPHAYAMAGNGMAVVALLILLGFIVWLGVKKGEDGPNRFGTRLGDKTPLRQADVFS